MEQKSSIISTELRKEDKLGTYKTLFMFLKNLNFHDTCLAFKKDANLSNEDISNAPSKTLVLKPSNQEKSRIDISVSDGILNENGPPEYSKYDDYSSRVSTGETSSSDDFWILKKKFQSLQDEHKKLTAVATELTNALHNNVMGQTHQMNKMLDSCKNIYPDLFIDQNLEQLIPTFQASPESWKNGNITPSIQINDSKSTSNRDEVFEEPTNVVLSEPNALSECKTDRSATSAHKNSKEILDYVISTVIDACQSIEKIELGSDNDENNMDKEALTTERLVSTSSRSKNSKNPSETNSPRQIDKNTEEENDNWNFSKIKSDLISKTTKECNNLLKSLRWLLTSEELKKHRESILKSYIRNDLLFLVDNTTENLVQLYLKHEYLPLQENMARMTNTFASFHIGRNYLNGKNCAILKNTFLPQILNNERIPVSNKNDMLIATLQKLSMEKEARTVMLQAGVFEYLVEYCHQTPIAFQSDYRWEYLTAWIMNLCLETETHDLCVKINATEKIVQTIEILLEHRKYNCLPYINGIMFSLLTHSEINGKARELRLADIIKPHINNPDLDETLRNQLNFILQSRLTDTIDFAKLSKSQTFENKQEDSEWTEPIFDLEEKFSDVDVTVLNSYRNPLSNECLIVKTETFCRPTTPIIVKSTTGVYTEKNTCNFDVMHASRIQMPVKTLNPYNQCKTESMPRDQKISPLSKKIGSSDKGRKYNGRGGTTRKRNERNRPKVNIIEESAPFCYMELCRRWSGNDVCNCSKCSGGTRYSCGCYEILRQDLEDDGDCDKKNLPKLKSFDKTRNWQPFTFEGKKWVTPRIYTADNICLSCGKEKCECSAFETRPKLKRTPP